jgi:hypothetical protein
MDIKELRKIITQNTIKSSLFYDEEAKIDADVIFMIDMLAERDIYFIGQDIYDDDELSRSFPEACIQGVDKKILFLQLSVELDEYNDPLSAFNTCMKSEMNVDLSKTKDTHCYIAADAWKDFKKIHGFASAVNRFKDVPLMLSGAFSPCANLLTAPSTLSAPSAVATEELQINGAITEVHDANDAANEINESLADPRETLDSSHTIPCASSDIHDVQDVYDFSDLDDLDDIDI